MERGISKNGLIHPEPDREKSQVDITLVQSGLAGYSGGLLC
jgi:hypothetical protein